VQRALGADVPPRAGAGHLEHPDVRLGGVPDVHVRVRRVGVRGDLPVEVLGYVRAAHVEAGRQQRAEHDDRDDDRHVQAPCSRRVPGALLRHRLGVRVPVLYVCNGAVSP
jgi:hypothetical protein